MKDDFFESLDEVIQDTYSADDNKDVQKAKEKLNSFNNIPFKTKQNNSKYSRYNNVMDFWKNTDKQNYTILNNTLFNKNIIMEKMANQYKGQQWGILKSAKNRDHYSISELLDCPMKNYYLRKGEIYDDNFKVNYPYAIMGQKVGTLIHNELQRMYDFDACEYKLDNKQIGVTGRIDAIKGDTIFEIKKSDDFTIWDDYIYQACIYCYLYNLDNNDSIKYFEIILAQPNFKDIRSTRYEYDEVAHNTAIYILNRINLINKALDEQNKSILQKELVLNKCVFCPYIKKCSVENQNNDLKLI